MTEHSLLLLIPAYNEERRIEPVLRDYARYFKEHYQGKFQLVVVLNGCTDDTHRRGAARRRGLSRRQRAGIPGARSAKAARSSKA